MSRDGGAWWAAIYGVAQSWTRLKWRSRSSSMSIETVMPCNHLVLCCPLLLPSIYPSIRVFSNESVLCIRWPKYWSLSFSISIIRAYKKSFFTFWAIHLGNNDSRQEEKGTTEDEMVGWHHRLDGHEFVYAPGVGDGQRSLVYCSPWGRKESDMTEQLNWTEPI